jgi:hypothetical protein
VPCQAATQAATADVNTNRRSLLPLPRLTRLLLLRQLLLRVLALGCQALEVSHHFLVAAKACIHILALLAVSGRLPRLLSHGTDIAERLTSSGRRAAACGDQRGMGSYTSCKGRGLESEAEGCAGLPKLVLRVRRLQLVRAIHAAASCHCRRVRPACQQQLRVVHCLYAGAAAGAAAVERRQAQLQLGLDGDQGRGHVQGWRRLLLVGRAAQVAAPMQAQLTTLLQLSCRLCHQVLHDRLSCSHLTLQLMGRKAAPPCSCACAASTCPCRRSCRRRMKPQRRLSLLLRCAAALLQGVL